MVLVFTAVTKINIKKILLFSLLPISFLSSCSSQTQLLAEVDGEEIGQLKTFDGDISNYVKDNWKTFSVVPSNAKAINIKGISSNNDYSLKLSILKNSPSLHEIQSINDAIASTIKDNVLSIEMKEKWFFANARTYQCFSLSFGNKHYCLGLTSGPNEASSDIKAAFEIDTSKIESINAEQTVLQDPGVSVTRQGAIEKDKAKTLYSNVVADYTLLSLPNNGQYQTPGVSMYSFTVNLDEGKTLSFDANNDGVILYNRSYYALDSKGLTALLNEAESVMAH